MYKTSQNTACLRSINQQPTMPPQLDKSGRKQSKDMRYGSAKSIVFFLFGSSSLDLRNLKFHLTTATHSVVVYQRFGCKVFLSLSTRSWFLIRQHFLCQKFHIHTNFTRCKSLSFGFFAICV